MTRPLPIHPSLGSSKEAQRTIDRYPHGLDKAELGDAAGIAITGRTFSTYLGDLTRNGAASRDGSEIRATDILMLRATR
ncbi:hypothetical protein [Herbiconiux daphne]|uniref:Uncharacterized protein n=1 Tax=Herbiconiux daphne TaxID=2970914 RepID=A0ABT2H1K2_9MICO|nr:hypothetical protein [Herbiconiux daphne]MCS5733796.1 hypothetical protein [Herbiconiux daphne]